MISIHPPRAGRDYHVPAFVSPLHISIHPPRAGRDLQEGVCGVNADEFQSTLPVRGGTSAG